MQEQILIIKEGISIDLQKPHIISLIEGVELFPLLKELRTVSNLVSGYNNLIF